jgi:hypothetical protein
VKKGPGRPRKVPKKDPIQRKGIVSEPMDTDSAVEFLYDSPMLKNHSIQGSAYLKKMRQSRASDLRPHFVFSFEELNCDLSNK